MRVGVILGDFLKIDNRLYSSVTLKNRPGMWMEYMWGFWEKDCFFIMYSTPLPYTLSPYARITPYYEPIQPYPNNLTLVAIQSQIALKNAKITYKIHKIKRVWHNGKNHIVRLYFFGFIFIISIRITSMNHIINPSKVKRV